MHTRIQKLIFRRLFTDLFRKYFPFTHQNKYSMYSCIYSDELKSLKT